MAFPELLNVLLGMIAVREKGVYGISHDYSRRYFYGNNHNGGKPAPAGKENYNPLVRRGNKYGYERSYSYTALSEELRAHHRKAALRNHARERAYYGRGVAF